MKPLNKDVQGLIIFILLFIFICFSALLFIPVLFSIDFHIDDRVAGLFFYLGIVYGYSILQLVMVYVLAMKMLNNTENKYLKKIFTPFDNSVKILLTLFIFDAAVNLIVGHNLDMYNYADRQRQLNLSDYNLYLAPSVKFLVIFLLACLNKLKPAQPKEE